MKNWLILGTILTALLVVIAMAPSEEKNIALKVTAESEPVSLTNSTVEEFWQWDKEIRRGLEMVDNDWDELWRIPITDYSQGYIDEITVIQNLNELEQRLIEDEIIFRESKVPWGLPKKFHALATVITTDYARWARERRQCCENYRRALINGTVTTEFLYKNISDIEYADTFVIQGNESLLDLESKINKYLQ